VQQATATDGDLARQAMAGQTAAYETLVRRWSPRVLALCHARVRDRAAAEDMAQETLLRGFRGLPTLADPDRFGAWLLGIAARTCLDWLKSAKRTEVGYAALGDAGEENIPARRSDDGADTKDDADRLAVEIQRLPEACRETLMLYYAGDCTYQELADALGVSPATINARLTKARTILRERLTRGTGVPPVSVPK
jgi:RNA polymerase sigma-70 factor (ECF subfamily)